jgi:hypothetical protein
MSLNKDKCGILQIAGRCQLSKEEDTEHTLMDIPYVENYKYLGVNINKNLKINV